MNETVSIDLASKWIAKYKAMSLLGLIDQRANNSGLINKYLDLYFLEELKRKIKRELMINGHLLKEFALQTSTSEKSEAFMASNS